MLRWVFVVGVILIGLVMLAFTFNLILSKWNSNEWPTIDGKIIRSEVKSDVKRVRDSDGTGRKSVMYYSADIEYEYIVNGELFRNDDVSVDDLSSTDPSIADSLVKMYPVDLSVKVYYNPANLSDSLLRPGLGIMVWGVSAVGLLFIIAGASLGIWYYKNRNN